jgi:hypothetical protein
MKSGSGLRAKAMADRGVAVVAEVAEVISEGKVAEMGVVSFPKVGFTVGMMVIGTSDVSSS